MALPAKSAKHLKSNINPHKFFQNISKEGTLVNTFYEVSITLTPNPDKETLQKRKLQLNFE